MGTGEPSPDADENVDAALPPSADNYNAFVAGLQLCGIDVVRVAGERRHAGHAPQTRFDLAAGVHVDNELILWRYDVIAKLTDPEDTDYGTIEASVVLAGQAAAPANPACMELFGATSGALMVHPYLRETIATTALRLGFTGVLLPMMTQQPSANPQESSAPAEAPASASI